ncbi:MAG: hypothetical protein C0404_15100 [Verrucomicrobia bacterium]|nr:hypothetical protein [Verrucomicrobiota bacterium]
MKGKILLGIALVYWVVSFGWLLRYEAYPELFTSSLEGYKGLLSRDVLITDSWMKILFKDSPIGYSHTSVEVADSNPSENYSVRNRMQLKMKLMGEVSNVHVDTTTTLNSMHELQKFSFSMFTRGYTLKLQAQRLDARKFNITTTTGTSTEKRIVEIPPDVVIYSPVTELAIKKLRPGQQLHMKTIDPATMTVANILIRATGREEITVGTNRYDTTVVVMDYRGSDVRSWIDDKGNLVKQDTPFGWTMETCSSAEAFNVIKTSAAPDDMLSNMAVRYQGRLRSPTNALSIRMQLLGVSFERRELETDRQTVDNIDGARLELNVRRCIFPDRGMLPASIPDAVREHLKPSPGLQSDHPDIIAAAADITRNASSDTAKARAIQDWVYTHVGKESAITLPSALDVLRTMKGDCNEHTYLYVALARAAGLPSKTTVGIVFHENAFYYHAWPSVWIGEWLETDPTWGQFGVDATHIALFHGDLQEQLNLVKVMGQLSIRILEEQNQ